MTVTKDEGWVTECLLFGHEGEVIANHWAFAVIFLSIAVDFSRSRALSKIAKKYQKMIQRMAEDDGDCNTRISLGLPEACVPDCGFRVSKYIAGRNISEEEATEKRAEILDDM